MSELSGILSLFFILAAFVTSCNAGPPQEQSPPAIMGYVAE